MIPKALPSSPEQIINGAPKAIAHLRCQLERKRLGLLFGAGISRDLGIPDWGALVRRIARDSRVKGANLLKKLDGSNGQGKSLASITQVLFEHFRQNKTAELELNEPLSFLNDQKIRSDWLRLIHSALYNKVNHNKRRDAINKHAYLSAFLPLIKNTSMTVNYNFDDTLEQLLMYNRTQEETNTTRGYETVFRPNAQFQKDSGVIYHPNGYLPAVFEDGASPDLVFADDSFQDQLISAAAGEYVQLSQFIFQNTCLLIGLSLHDSTLQHLLRQSAVSNPGHVHYMVHFTDSDRYDHKTFEAIFEANFSSYNIYTLFLDRNGIRSLADLVSTKSGDLQFRYPAGQHKFVYYIIGSIGAGKSTATSNLRSLTTYDEWIDPRRPDMAVPESKVSAKTVREINQWTAEQFRKKNISVSQSANGIHVIDRCPLDPLTFGKPAGRAKKAKQLMDSVTNNGKQDVQKGHLIYLDADTEDLINRISYRHKYWTNSELGTLQARITEVYGEIDKTVLCTRGRSAKSVAKELAKIIFLGKYEEVDIGYYLQSIADDKKSARP